MEYKGSISQWLAPARPISKQQTCSFRFWIESDKWEGKTKTSTLGLELTRIWTMPHGQKGTFCFHLCWEDCRLGQRSQCSRQNSDTFPWQRGRIWNLLDLAILSWASFQLYRWLGQECECWLPHLVLDRKSTADGHMLPSWALEIKFPNGWDQSDTNELIYFLITVPYQFRDWSFPWTDWEPFRCLFGICSATWPPQEHC